MTSADSRECSSESILSAPRPRHRRVPARVTVYVEGYPARHGDRDRVSVIGRRAWSIEAAPPPPEEAPAAGSHASPGSTSGRAREARGDSDSPPLAPH